MKKFALFLLLLAPACAIPGDAAWSDLHANAFLGMYNVDVDGTAGINVADPGSGTSVDGDLTVNKNSDSSLYYGVRAGFAPIELIASGFSSRSTHSGTFVGDFDAGTGTPITGTANATTLLDFDQKKLMLGFDIFNSPVFRVGLLAGVDFFTFNDFSVTATKAGITQTYIVADDENAPIPIVGLRGDVALPNSIRLGAEVTGMSANVQDIDVSFLDFDAQVGWAPMDNEWVELLIGYRNMNFDFNGDFDGTAIDANLDFGGFYWAVGITF
jgi:hypothetical protein